MESVWPMGIIPITAKELKEFQDKVEMLAIYERQYGNMVEHALKLEDMIKAVKMWLKNAKAQGRISMSDGMKLDEILGVEG